MRNLINYQSYDDFHKAFGDELNNAAGSFVKIGYLCKVARDTDILLSSGYSNIYDYAKSEFGIDKSQVSRFVRINDRFSIDGNSPELKEQFSQIGSSKLTLMLSLPDALNDIITPDMTKEDIKVLKDEVEAENQVTDMEIYAEAASMPHPVTGLSLIDKITMHIMHDYADVFKAAETNEPTSLRRATMPEDNHTYSVRVPGQGRIVVHFTPNKISMINIRSGESVNLEWFDYYKSAFEVAQKAWEDYFSEPFEKAAEVAPVQPEEKPKTKVNPAPVKKEVTKKPAKEEKKKKEPEPEPETIQDVHEETAEALADVTDDKAAELVEGTVEDNGGQLKKDLTDAMHRFVSCVVEDKYPEAKNYLAVMQTLLDSILEKENR